MQKKKVKMMQVTHADALGLCAVLLLMMKGRHLGKSRRIS